MNTIFENNMDMIQPDIFINKERPTVVKWLFNDIIEAFDMKILRYNVILDTAQQMHIITITAIENNDCMSISNISMGAEGTGGIFRPRIGPYIIDNKNNKVEVVYHDNPDYRRDIDKIIHSKVSSVNIPDSLYDDMVERMITVFEEFTRQ